MSNNDCKKHQCSRADGEDVLLIKEEEFCAQNSIGLAFRSVNNLMKRCRCASELTLECEQLTGMHGYILGYLYYRTLKEDVFQRDIEDVFGIRRSTATQMLQLMEKNGLIERSAVDYDARLKKITLTEKALQLHIMVIKECERVDAAMLEGVDGQELKTFFKVVDKIKDNLDKLANQRLKNSV